ncbi:MAG TPA: LysR substrate-binding domain-containing protein [Thermoleophilaceae bacterium]|nr:LysR substrate-binding domain-containing protein [Thermoleophilaceae bacterium]
MLDPRRLSVLREFAAQGTIARAADALAFTPSAVSQQLAQLQREAGTELFRKVGRRLELTDAGRMLVARADELLAHVEGIEAELAAFSGRLRGTVRVAAFQTAAHAVVLPALDRLADEHPDLRVELRELEAEVSLPLVAGGGLEVAVAEEYEHAPRPRLPRLHRDYLPDDEMLLALPAGHAAAGTPGPVPLASLSDDAWATAKAGTAYADMCERICRSSGGFEPDVRHRANDLALLLDLVARGCTAIVPALGRPERDRRIQVRRIADAGATRSIFIAVRASDRGRPSTASVVEALRRTRASPGRPPA